MQYKYPTIFEDRFGKEETICYSDGYTFQITIRGITFRNISFNMIELEEEDKAVNSDKFDFRQGTICAVFRVAIPLKIVKEGNIDEGILHLDFDYRIGNDITFALHYNEEIYSSSKPYGFVEDILIAIQQLLPINCRLRCCLVCRFSSYHPIGNNDFGCLNCFKNIKKQLHSVVDKHSLMQLWDKGYANKKLINVQETFQCSCFEEPIKETWMYKTF